MPDNTPIYYCSSQRRIWVGKGSVRWFNFNGASHKSSALAFEAKGDGALPSAPTKGPGILGPDFFRIHRGATGSRGKLKPFMLWVRIPPMEPFGGVLELEYGRGLNPRVQYVNMELRVRLPPSPPFYPNSWFHPTDSGIIFP